MKRFVKVLITRRTMISALIIVQEELFSHYRKIFDGRRTIIVYLLCNKATTRTNGRFSLQEKERCISVSVNEKSFKIMSSNSRSFDIKSYVGIGFNPFCRLVVVT